VCLALMVFTALGWLALLGFEIAGDDVSRFSGVVFSSVVTALLAALMPFPPRRAAGSFAAV